ncbi:MAG: hypothetical protein ACKPKO_44620, partial [Candidatus Fonsibacter sp.]
RRDDDGTFYWAKGPRDFDTYSKECSGQGLSDKGPQGTSTLDGCAILPSCRRRIAWTRKAGYTPLPNLNLMYKCGMTAT